MWRAFGVFLEGWATAASGAPGRRARGHAPRRRHCCANRTSCISTGSSKIALAEAEARAGDPTAPSPSSTKRWRRATAIGHRAFEAELHRARGDTAAQTRPRQPRARGRRFPDRHRRREAARHAQLRTARGASLAKLYQSTGRPADAHAVLAPALEGFPPTTEMPEIAEAQALLAALAETDEVKAEAARRQRLTQLHVAYGNALIAARGYGAPETTEAFAKGARIGSRRQGRARTIGGRLRFVGRQLRARRVAVDAGARRGLPRRRRGETRFARGRRRPSRRRDNLLVRRRISRGAGSSWNARSPYSNPAATTIWLFVSDRTPASWRCIISRLRYGRSATSIARFR